MLKINSSNNHFQTFEKHLLTINNNEIYQKLRPLKIITNIFKEHQAHGDDIHIQISEKSPIPPKSSSSNQFSITDTSNEALKTDDENGMTKSYFLSKDKEIILSDVSLEQQQQLPIDECEYEIDLGNGWITKSISSYQKQRTTSIISADSIQPISTFYKQKQETTINYPIESNVLINSQQKWPKFSLRTLTIFSIGTTIIIFLIIVVFFI